MTVFGCKTPSGVPANLTARPALGTRDVNANAGDASTVNPICTAQPTGPCTERGPNVPIIDVARGGMHTCALLQGGCVRCWAGWLGPEHIRAKNAILELRGQLGVPGRQRNNERALWDLGANVQLGGKAVAIRAGADYTCVLLEEGCVKCWGDNEDGQLGLGNTENVGDNEPPSSSGSVKLNGRVASVVTAQRTACALLDNGQVRCWGANDAGQLGQGHTLRVSDRQPPLALGAVQLGGRVKMLAAGVDFFCTLLENQSVRCWGNGGNGVLGQPEQFLKLLTRPNPGPHEPESWRGVGDDEVPADVPPVALPAKTIGIYTGGYHACAQLEDLSVACWGDNSFYELGFHGPDQVNQPRKPTIRFPEAQADGIFLNSESTCTLGTTGTVYCAGTDGDRTLWLLDEGSRATAKNGGLFPGIRKVPHLLHPKKLLVGAYQPYPCALVSDTNIRCWEMPP